MPTEYRWARFGNSVVGYYGFSNVNGWGAVVTDNQMNRWQRAKAKYHAFRAWRRAGGTLNLEGATVAFIIGFLHIIVSVLVGLGLPTLTEADRHPWYWLGTASTALLALSLVSGREKQRESAKQEVVRTYEASQQEIQKQQEGLISLLRTMPPAGALATFIDSYRLTRYTFRQLCADNQTPDTDRLNELETEIRVVLKTLSSFFARYQHKPIATTCSANLALFIPIADIQGYPEVKKRVLETLRYVEDKDDPLHALDGVLYVNPDLSSHSEVNAQLPDSRDPGCRPISLPIPSNDTTNGRYSKFIPVAPRAFKWGYYFVADVKTLCDEETVKTWNVRRDVANELVEYFGSRTEDRIGTILSERLVLDFESEKKEDHIHIGVLNIHTAGPAGIDEAMVLTYIDQARPMFELLKDMLRERTKLQQSVGRKL